MCIMKIFWVFDGQVLLSPFCAPLVKVAFHLRSYPFETSPQYFLVIALFIALRRSHWWLYVKFTQPIWVISNLVATCSPKSYWRGTLHSLSMDPRDKIQKKFFVALGIFCISEPRYNVVRDCNPSRTPFWGFF